MKLLMKGLLGAVIFSFAAASSANLVVNGGFEDSLVNEDQWKWFESRDVNGWDGSTIEIWDNFQDFESYEGDQHAELNAHGNRGLAFSIFQTFATTIGQTYDVSFAYAARTNNNEQFRYSISDINSQIDSVLIDNDKVKEWTFYESSFVALSTTSNIIFTAVTPHTATVGNFLDSVSVIARPPVSVSSPASIALILCGLFGMMFARAKAA